MLVLMEAQDKVFLGSLLALMLAVIVIEGRRMCGVPDVCINQFSGDLSETDGPWWNANLPLYRRNDIRVRNVGSMVR